MSWQRANDLRGQVRAQRGTEQGHGSKRPRGLSHSLSMATEDFVSAT